MDGATNGLNLANEPDFPLGGLDVSPSACRVGGGGQDVRVEAKAMAVLVVLARAAGATVTREELIAACWGGRVVSDDAISRTIAKVRALARLVSPAPFSLETVPKVGYRLLAAGVADQADQIAPPLQAARMIPRLPNVPRHWLLAGLVVAAVLAIAPLMWATAPRGDVGYDQGPPHAPEVMDALMHLDERRLPIYLRQGWDPNWKLDSEGNAALHQIMMVCERHPEHDQSALTRIVRLLVDSGADPTTRNKWDDTPLRIARSERYCGPDHPVVAYLSEITGEGAQ